MLAVAVTKLVDHPCIKHPSPTATVIHVAA